MTEARQFRPDWISPPGDTIQDLLDELDYTKAEFALRTGFTAKHINELIKGRAPITADTAERLALVLGSTSNFWLTREAKYRAAVHRRASCESLAEQGDWLRELPLAWMKKRGWIAERSHKGEQVEECLHFFSVASVEAWRINYAAPLAAFRASEKFEKKIGAVATWLRKGELLAAQRRCNPFTKTGLRDALAELRSLTAEPDPQIFVPRLTEACARHGVVVVFVPAPPGCPASGATRWLAPDKAILQLSLRYKSNDHLWFSFFHEAAHLLLHGKKLQFIEGIDGLDTTRETEADHFARELLISSTEARRLPDLEHTPHAINEFAKEIGVAPGVIVGRMQWEGLLPWKSGLNSLKVRYEWGEP